MPDFRLIRGDAGDARRTRETALEEGDLWAKAIRDRYAGVHEFFADSPTLSARSLQLRA